MAKKREVYKVKLLTEGKKNIIAGLLQEYGIQTADDIQDQLWKVNRKLLKININKKEYNKQTLVGTSKKENIVRLS